jgi:thiol-disulfide isomerase/thioredoxin
MRFPIVIGVLAGLVIGFVALAGLVNMIGEQVRVAPPTPVTPTAPPFETPAPTAAAAAPSPAQSPATASPTAAASPPNLSTEPPEMVAIGQRAPRIRLAQLNGGEVDTRDYRGRPMWINFMATWCPQCRDELPMMQTLQTQLEEEMTILLVDVDEDEETVAQFLDSLNVDLLTALDEDAVMQQQWGAYALPIHFWIDEQGVIQSILYGGAPRDLFIESLRTVVPDAEIE